MNDLEPENWGASMPDSDSVTRPNQPKKKRSNPIKEERIRIPPQVSARLSSDHVSRLDRPVMLATMAIIANMPPMNLIDHQIESLKDVKYVTSSLVFIASGGLKSIQHATRHRVE
jgi:hypothetical protein